ncbi:unnamed protein product [Blepharisma stoltei]|uniref:U-box domain-containing protein n=1 Tax=Blepharisma stoltei TaxID=1481888 RepID=A0AAU9IDB8_9CILI|nr:unnamed protein product [Blepharisma stoltei]
MRLRKTLKCFKKQLKMNEWNQSVKVGQQILDSLCIEAKRTLQNKSSEEDEKDTENVPKEDPAQSNIDFAAPIRAANNNEALIKEFENIEYEEGMEALLCPISNELMTDPAMTPYGHCYQRQHIEMWLDNHNTCPLTGQILRKDQLIPCFTVKAAVEQYLKMQENKRKKESKANE